MRFSFFGAHRSMISWAVSIFEAVLGLAFVVVRHERSVDGPDSKHRLFEPAEPPICRGLVESTPGSVLVLDISRVSISDASRYFLFNHVFTLLNWGVQRNERYAYKKGLSMP